MSAQMEALCCICGSLRTCSRPRNHRAENFWFKEPVDLDWHRETGDLKCAECGRITTHALIYPEADTLRDHAEMMQRVATGNSHGHFNEDELVEVRKKYRQGFPRNPYVSHFWWDGDAKEAWAAGRRTVLGLCGEPMEIMRDPSSVLEEAKQSSYDSDGRQIQPKKVRDQEYEDDETGLWWTEMYCVDCLRVWHLELLRQRRELLAVRLTEFLADLLADKTGYPKKIDLQTVNALVEAFDTAQQHLGVKSQDVKK